MEQNKEERRILRAILEPSNSEDYDFTAVATPTNNGQVRYSHMNDEYFVQVLRTSEQSIKVDRLKSGLPVFDNHEWEKSASKTLGISVGYDFTERGLEVKVKLGARADEALRNDIKNGIIKTMSIEGDVLSYEIKREQGKLPVYEAELWEPTSVSFAPVPQDIDAQIEVKRGIEKQLQVNQTSKSQISKLISKFKK